MIDSEKYKKLEFSLEQFEKEFKPFLLQAKASILLYQDYKLLAANDYFFQEFGYQERDLEKVDAMLWHSSEERRRFREMVDMAIAGEKVENDDFLISSGTGEQLSVVIHFGTGNIYDHSPVCCCMPVRNPLPIFTGEVSKDQEDGVFKAIADQSLNGIGLVDRRFRIIYMNPAGLDIYGFKSIEEARRTPIIKTIAPESFNTVIERAKNWMQGTPNTSQLVYKIVRRDSEIRDLLVNTGELYLNGKKYHLNTFIDITDRVRAEDVLQKAANEWRITFDTMMDPIMVLDRDQRVIRTNKAMTRMLGLTFKEMIGKKCFECVHGTEEPPDYCPNAQKNEKMRSEIYEPKLQRHYVITISPLTDESGTVTGSIHAMHDITEIKKAEEEHNKLEEQLRQSQKMEAVGRLAGGVAHDFNNLLAVIRSYSTFLSEELTENEQFQEDVKVIWDATERGAMLTRQLLAFSRKETIKPIIIDLNIVIKNLNKMLVRLIGEDIELSTELEESSWNVKVDPGQIEQVLVNLVANARDAMPTGGKLTIETENVHLDENDLKEHADFQVGDYVLLSVSDAGCGMDEETISQIFEPFFTTKGIGKGTGLGLSTVYGIVKQNSGDIKVYSKLDEGTTFKIWLPRVGEELAKPLAKKKNLKKFLEGSETILLVEDERSLLKVIRRALIQKGYTVLEASSGDEAINLCKQHTGPIHLMVTDVIMPGMSGRVLADQLASMRPGMKVLFVSGYTDDALGPHGVLDPDIPFLQKPFLSEELHSKVREMLDES